MDKTDKKILVELQKDCRQSISTLSEKVALSTSACHRRIKIMEEQGIIEGYKAQLNGKKVGKLIEFFIEASLGSQQQADLDLFENAVKKVPEILECHLMTGQADYVLRIGAASTEDYEKIYREKIAVLPGISRIQSSLLLRTVTRWSGYTIDTDQA